MANIGYKGSYLGFTYNGMHSSTLGITRISNSNRYSTNLVPTIKDVTSNIEGVDGVLYFGAKYTKRDIPVSFAFENIDQEQLIKIQTFLNVREIYDLIFDEHPYKVYSAKITGSIITKNLCFCKDGLDYYNGEGSITFTCYFPFARSRFNWKEQYTEENIKEWRVNDNNSEHWIPEEKAVGGNLFYDFSIAPDITGKTAELTQPFTWVSPITLLEYEWIDYDSTMNGALTIYDYEHSNFNNYNEWINSSRIPSNQQYGKYIEFNHSITLFNAGDIEMPTRWWFRIDPNNKTQLYNITISCNNQILSLVNLHYLQINSSTGAGADYYIVIDMVNGIIGGYDQDRQFTGRIYNQFMQGNFFGIPTGEQCIYISGGRLDNTRESPVDFYYLYL